MCAYETDDCRADYKTITTEQLAKVMHRVVFRHFGLPRKLISDQDPRFMSDFKQALVRAVCTKLNISASYHPHTDGQSERVNRTWEQAIRNTLLRAPLARRLGSTPYQRGAYDQRNGFYVDEYVSI
jgi:hypothetical protein